MNIDPVECIKAQASIIEGRASNERLMEQGRQMVAQYPEMAGTVYSVLGSMAFSQYFYEATMESRFGVTAAKFDSRNSSKVVRLDTHRLTAMEEDVRYPIEDLRQGRDCTNRVPRYSMLAGKPIDHEEEGEHAARALFWQTYVGCIALVAIVSAAIKVLG